MRRSPIEKLLLLGVVVLGILHSQSVKGATGACDQTFSGEEGALTLTVSSSVPVCNTHVSGPNNSVVLLTFTIPPVDEFSEVTLEISDEWDGNTTTVYMYTHIYNDSDVDEEQPTTNLYSFSPTVLLALESNGADFSVDVSYTIEDHSNMTTVLANDSGIIEVRGDSNRYTNFRHTWYISAGTDNFLFFYINNVTLNDTAGDFLAIGTGSEVFAEAPALMLTSQWIDYPTVHLNGTEAYVLLFMKSYSPDMGISLYYDNWLYTPPTLLPQFTKPPLIIHDAYFYYDDDDDNYHDVVTNFTKYIKKYAYQYCAMDTSTSDHDHLPNYPIVLDVEVAQVVDTNPCLVVEFYIDILNGTCLNDISFSNDDFGWLLGNYSSQLNSDFGRDVMQSCPMKLLWILAVVVVLFVAVLVTVFVGFKSIDMDKTGLLANQEDENSEDAGAEHPSAEPQDPESEFYDESGWARVAQPNDYEENVRPSQTAPRDSDEDSLERQKEEAYMLDKNINDQVHHGPDSQREEAYMLDKNINDQVHGGPDFQREYYMQRDILAHEFLHKSSFSEDIELSYLSRNKFADELPDSAETIPRLNRQKSVAIPNPNKERMAISLRNIGAINIAYVDDELDDERELYGNEEDNTYEEIHRLPQEDSSPLTSSHSESYT